MINLLLQTSNSIAGKSFERKFRIRSASGLGLHDVSIHADGAYFCFKVGNHILHGDSWALASYLSCAEATLAKHEVLYVGQAFGPRGRGNAYERTKEHKKLQRIYEDHVSRSWDIFVTPIRLFHGSAMSDDHIDDVEAGFDLDSWLEVFSPSKGISKTVVDLIEHSLISYFSPHYNEMLKTWQAGNPTSAMRAMRGAGFRLLQVHLDGWMGLTRFYSAKERELVRSHFISQDIPPEPRRPVLSGISAQDISDWRLPAQSMRTFPALLAAQAEMSGTEIKIFGDEAPKLRIPPEVDL
ncbi:MULTISPECIES: hypothetical protein [unclassified Nonomuraea]|uniref:hypothetical protein n=1 Tax=unclassified Nonomuraea TaxID=2593643 RepID=UPI0033D915C0